MGYRIEYLSHKKEHRLWIVLPMTWAFFLLFCLLVHLFWPQGQQLLQELLWPGDAAVTRQAAEAMVQQLRWGVPVSEAVETFCMTIINGS